MSATPKASPLPKTCWRAAMFEHGAHPRVFGIAPGLDFPATLIAGLRTRLDGGPPEQIARIDLIVNTRRMARRLRDIFDAGPAGFLPRIHLLTSLDALIPHADLPPPSPPLRRRLDLIQLVSTLLDADGRLAPRTSLYDLSDSLAKLIDEMQGEGVSPADIAALDVTDQSGHWERAKQFFGIAQQYLGQTGSAPDAEARQRQLTQALIAGWDAHPPQHPVLLAGSTGSRGTTALLMQAVARLPQGAVVLPGFDFDMPTAVWADLEDALLSEDHPQYRFRHLMTALDLPKDSILPWHDTPPPSAMRNKLVSLSLRPAPVTHAWLSEGPQLSGLEAATKDMTLVEATSPRQEALTIALRLRKAAQEGQTAALITPDRMLTRQVTAALDRWNILPDDSAGTPLHLSPPGRFLRHVAGLFRAQLDAETLLTLLKHPLTHAGADRNLHQLHTQRLEMQIRRDGLPYPDAGGLERIASRAARKLDAPDDFQRWTTWVSDVFCGQDGVRTDDLSEWVTRHLERAERIASGSKSANPDPLWHKHAGRKAREVMDDLAAHADHGGQMSAADYTDLVGALLSAAEVRDRDAPHPRIMIWGTLEARVQGADLVILGGLNDGTWPEAPPPDPWLNRTMRKDAGLLLPERRIGLSAHDYQQAIAAPEVWLTRAIRSDEAETVPSRWLNRLGNLLTGLPDAGGRAAWDAMRERGEDWLAQTAALEQITPTAGASRPAPRPPAGARPRKLSVTEIKKLIRDPYAIYARHVLGLRAIDPLVPAPDAPMRGIVVHKIMEEFIKSVADDITLLTTAHLMEHAEAVLTREVPWPATRAMWLARVERIAEWFIDHESARQRYSRPVAFEEGARGSYLFKDIGFEIIGFADRIDMTDNGDALIYDYKTGAPPTKKEQTYFDKQLLIEAAMVEEGAFAGLPPTPVAAAIYIGLGSNPDEISAPLDDEPPARVLAGLHALLTAYLAPDRGFLSRRIVQTEGAQGEFDQLARYGEWDGTDLPVPEDLT